MKPKSKTPKAILATLSTLALAAAPFASAALVNVNFNKTGDELESALVGAGGGLGTTWNQYTGTSSTGSLLDSTNAASNVTVATNFGGTETYTGGTPLLVFESELTDFGRGETRTVTVAGLVSGNSYDVWLHSARKTSADGEQFFGTWTTGITTQTIDGRDAGSAATNTRSFEDNVNYVLFANVEAVAGQIVFTSEAAAGYRNGLNAIQIADVVPEPSTTALLGLGGLALILRRRK